MTPPHLETAMIGSSPPFRQVLDAARLVAATRASVLISGESGSGKENLGRYLHAHSPLAKYPFIAINCANLPASLADAEFFGHRRGAFSNALRDRDGLIKAAQGGTLFLDEIAELPRPIQAKLLRFLETGEILPLGSDTPASVETRVIAATNGDLAAMVEKGRFRADLYYRLQVVPLRIPALRERREDILPLTRHFLKLAAQRHDLPELSLSLGGWQVLASYPWPGNLRELRNLCERLTILHSGLKRPLEVEELPTCLTECHPTPLEKNLENPERTLIRQALEQCRGNRSQTAKLLGISRYALAYRIKKYLLEDQAGTQLRGQTSHSPRG